MPHLSGPLKIAGVAMLLLAGVAYTVPASNAIVLRSELDTLKAELEATRTELDGFRHAPDRLAARIKDALSAGAVDSAQHYLALLVRYHPQSPERAEAEKRVEADVARIEAERKATAEKAERERRAVEEKRLAEERAAREREARALRAMRKKNDDMRGVTFYQDPASPAYVNSRSTLYYYIGHRPGSQPTLRAKLIYKGEDWVFFKTAYAKVGDEVFRFDFGHFGVERDNGYGGVWEWIDVEVSGEWRRLAERLATTGGTVRLRFDGDQYHRERTMPAGDVAAVRRVLDAYTYLQQNPGTR